MPIVSPQLDDLGYDRLVEELKRRIPVYSPQWTDWNDSDPGMTLIQLFAHLAEMVGYRLNQIPQKNLIQLLQLLGIELNPAQPAKTQLALLLANPATATSTTLLAGASGKATVGSPPPSFQTTEDVDIIPAEVAVIVTTKNKDISNPTDSSASATSAATDYLTVAWDGKAPPLKTMPLSPIALMPTAGQPYLWIGVNCNSAIDAGFLGVQVTLTIQFDDDEQPSFTAVKNCGPRTPQAEKGTAISWLSYYDAVAAQIKQVPRRIQDTTNRLANSGTITFTVPTTIGPIATFKDLWDPTSPASTNPCAILATNLHNQLPVALGQNASDTAVNKWIAGFSSALTSATQQTASGSGTTPPKPVSNPLDPKYRSTPTWFLIDLSSIPAGQAIGKLRMITFNAVPAINATTVTNELLGVGDGTPGQTFTLANQNVQMDSIQVSVQESDAADAEPLVPWSVVATLDDAGAYDRELALDAEAGVLTSGDGEHGMILPLVPGGGQVVALTYTWGGGEAGNVGVGTIKQINSSAPGVAGVVNFVTATGGRDPETLEDAEIRARKLLSTRSRAVTAEDFRWIATQTTTVEVAMAQVVPLCAPLGSSSPYTAVSQTPCGADVPTAPAGLDNTTTAAGVVSVIVVPREDGLEPTPTPSFLQAVADYIDPFRLVTTQVYVVPPQFCRICNLTVSVKGKPGYTRDQLQTAVSNRLATYLHVLTGGDDGTGYPFGNQLHIADLIAQIYRVDGVERVDDIGAEFVRTKTDANPRQGSLALCASGSAQSFVNLALEETVSFGSDTFLLSTVS